MCAVFSLISDRTMLIMVILKGIWKMKCYLHLNVFESSMTVFLRFPELGESFFKFNITSIWYSTKDFN